MVILVWGVKRERGIKIFVPFVIILVSVIFVSCTFIGNYSVDIIVQNNSGGDILIATQKGKFGLIKK